MNVSLVNDYLKDQIQAIDKLTSEAQNKPSAKRIHQLRNSIRRFKSLQKLPPPAKKLMKVLARQRDLDVAIKNAKNYGLPLSELRKSRKKAHRLTRKYLSREKRKRLLSSLTKHDKVRYRERAITFLKKIDYWLAVVPQNEDLHQMRIDIKKIRYFLEAVHHRFDYLENLLDLLGKIHDLEVFEALTGKNQLVRDDRQEASLVVIRITKPLLKKARNDLLTCIGQ